MDGNRNFLKESFEKAGFSLSRDQLDAFLCYYERLITVNQVMNLTAITEFREVVFKHFLDSVLPLSFLPLKGSLIDVGSGAGFPGLPLKIMQPEIQLTMLDSLNKRVKYLQELVRELKLKNAEAVHGRAEEYAAQHRAFFDAACARAVAKLSVLSEYCLPFVKTGGLFIAYKGADVENELQEAQKALQLLGGKVEDVRKLELPENAGGRSIILIRKVRETPKKYPRRAGLPAKEPL